MAVKHLCPDCETLREIVCTGEPQSRWGSSQWWVIETHKHPDRQELCLGSGKRV